MKKVHIIAVIVVILIIASIAIVSAIGSAKERAAVRECETIPGYTSADTGKRMHCFTDLAIKYDNPTYCMGEDATCYALVASNRNDDSLCNELKLQSKEFCYYKYASLQNDTNICVVATTGNFTTDCISDIAVNQKSEELCDTKLNLVDEKEHCYHAVALSQSDSTLCNKIITNKPQIWERDQCYWDVALATGSKVNCDNIENTQFKESCYFDIEQLTVR